MSTTTFRWEFFKLFFLFLKTLLLTYGIQNSYRRENEISDQLRRSIALDYFSSRIWVREQEGTYENLTVFIKVTHVIKAFFLYLCIIACIHKHMANNTCSNLR